MNPNELPESLTVVDDSGIPDHVVSPKEVTEDAFTLALAIGAADGDENVITNAISDVLTEWDKHAGYVFASAITQFSRDLLPMLTSLNKAATDDYDPRTVDTTNPASCLRQGPGEHIGSRTRTTYRRPPMTSTNRPNYLERIAQTADQIEERAEFLAEQASNEGTYQIDDPDARELCRDLLHSIIVDAQQMSLLMDIEAPSSPWPDSPHYITMETRYLPPDEAAAQGFGERYGVKHMRAHRADLNRPTAKVTPLFKTWPQNDSSPDTSA